MIPRTNEWIVERGGVRACGAIEAALGKKIKHFWLLKEATLRRKTALVKFICR